MPALPILVALSLASSLVTTISALPLSGSSPSWLFRRDCPKSPPVWNGHIMVMVTNDAGGQDSYYIGNGITDQTPGSFDQCFYQYEDSVTAARFSVSTCQDQITGFQCLNCGSGNYFFGITGVTSDHGVGDPVHLYPRIVASGDATYGVIFPTGQNPVSETQKAKVWTLDMSTFKLSLQWSSTSTGKYSSYLAPYIGTDNATDGRLQLVYSSTPPVSAIPADVYFLQSL